jgi:hypothetical protein
MSKDHPLISYIEEAHSRGITNKQIIQALTAAGWHAHDMATFFLITLICLYQVQIHLQEKNIITVRNVSKFYGKKVRALDGVSLDVRRGSVTALLGPNGAGKQLLFEFSPLFLLQIMARCVSRVWMKFAMDSNYARLSVSLANMQQLMICKPVETFMVDDCISSKKPQARAIELLRQFDL